VTAGRTVAETLAAGFAHIDAGRVDEARRVARLLAKQMPGPPGLAYLEALIALADKDGAKAARHLARALAATPGAPPLLLAMARAQALQGRDAAAEDYYRRLILKAPDAEIGRVELAALLIGRGIARRDAGEAAMAAALFGEAASFDPGSTLAHVLLAETQEQLGAHDAAVRAYRAALALDPKDPHGTALALARLSEGDAPPQAPPAFVARLFDDYADRFETSLVERLRYRGPALLLDAIRRSLGDGPFAVFDAGCGTGLMGAAIKPFARRLDGADLSPRMVEKARVRGIYDRLTTGEIAALLAAAPASYDLVTAADVLVYIGDLAPVTAAVAAALKPGGGFAFSAETDAGGEWRLNESGRYAHGEDYLRRLAAGHGFDVALLEDAPAREDRGVPVPGLVCVLRKLP
jgi:predicted TPR repeat methyltransferase